jgi:hypothetical protein
MAEGVEDTSVWFSDDEIDRPGDYSLALAAKTREFERVNRMHDKGAFGIHEFHDDS